jgi:hypothetical protein
LRVTDLLVEAYLMFWVMLPLAYVLWEELQ